MQLSTGGSVRDPYDARLAVLDAEPDSCSLTCGTVNFGDDVFLNPWPFMSELYALTQEREIVPEFELFDLGQVAALHRLLDEHGAAVRRAGALRPGDGRPRRDPRHPRRRLAAAVRALPEGATWSATGVGRATLPVALAALAAGGHLRVGMEDTLTFTRGVPVRDNAQLVERAAQLAALADRPALTTDDARAMLRVKDRTGARR